MIRKIAKVENPTVSRAKARFMIPPGEPFPGRSKGAEAEVYIPAAAKAQVREGHVAALKAAGVRYSGRIGEAEVFVIGSGVYEFRVMN